MEETGIRKAGPPSAPQVPPRVGRALEALRGCDGANSGPAISLIGSAVAGANPADLDLAVRTSEPTRAMALLHPHLGPSDRLLTPEDYGPKRATRPTEMPVDWIVIDSRREGCISNRWQVALARGIDLAKAV